MVEVLTKSGRIKKGIVLRYMTNPITGETEEACPACGMAMAQLYEDKSIVCLRCIRDEFRRNRWKR